MTSTLNKLLFASALAVASLNATAAGFRELVVADPGSKNLNVGLWYPSAEPAPDSPNTKFGLAVALNAPMHKPNGGLILISHGFGGWYAGHADTAAALADAGFIVAAPSHTGNTWSDMSSSIDKWALDRPRHISRVIDHVLADDELSAIVETGKIGVYGFSAGGYTAMNLIGGVPDLERAQQFCDQNPQEFTCVERMLEPMFEADMAKLPATAWGADSRITAAAIAAPGLGFAYTRENLSSVTADVQLWSGELDTSVPTQNNAALIAARLPSVPETHWIDKATHFAFMIVPCRDVFKQEDPEEYEMVCGDAEGFDRRAFLGSMQQEMVRFFSESFGSS